MPNQEELNYLFSLVNYYPTESQLSIHLSEARIRLVAGGERAGKSLSAEKDLFARHIKGKLFWLVAADYARTGAEFRYLCDDLDKAKIAYEATKHVDPGEIITELGIRIVTKSSKDPRRLAMEAPDGVVVCEASQIDYETFLRLSGRLAEKRGWMLLSGTFESSIGWYVDMYQRGQAPNSEGIQSFSLPTWTNRIVFPGGRDDPEIKRLEAQMTPEWFSERFGGVPCPPKGLVFPEFRVDIHTGIGAEFEFDPLKECYLFIDPGYANAYAVLVAQRRGEDLVIFDEIYERGLITSDIIKVAKQRPWWNRVIGGAIDVAATQHQAMAAPIEIWSKEAGVPLHAQRIRIQDGVEAYKRFLLVNPLTGKPLIRINTKCQGLISEHGGCPNPIDGQTKVYKWLSDREGNIVGDVPEDKNNHAIKALCYGVVDMFGFTSTYATKARVRFI